MTELIAPPAAVVGGSLVSFASDLPASHREDIYMSTAFAQKATRAAISDGLSGDWFNYYCNQLRFLGWDVPSPQAILPSPAAPMGSKALQRIRETIGERFSTSIGNALTSLERNAQALKVFESISLNGDIAHFQMIPCVRNGQHKVDMAIYYRRFSMLKNVTRYLFTKNESLEQKSTEQITTITFNTLYYGEYREKVKRSVISQSLNYLSALDI